MSNAIFILTGPIQSGKTTWLMDNVADQQLFSGILQPVIDGSRVIIDIHTRISKQLEADTGIDESTVSVGKYKFLQSTFDWAKNVLKQSVEQEKEWIIIDEIGKLEIINHQGLEPIVSELITMRINNTLPSKLLLVVRDTLVESAVAKYNLQHAVITTVAERQNGRGLEDNFFSNF